MSDGAITCPHNCGISFARLPARTHNVTLGADASTARILQAFTCPDCDRPVVEYIEVESKGANVPGGIAHDEKLRRIIYPRPSRKAAPEVPPDFARDFEEAAAVLGDSPRAAAALGRRCLQHVLRERHGATGGNLEREIDSVGDRLQPYILESLHVLRHIGNFAAHPIKDASTGEVVDVEPGEAEWTLDTLDALLAFTFVGPVRQQARRDALNEKLRAAGKPELPAAVVDAGPA